MPTGFCGVCVGLDLYWLSHGVGVCNDSTLGVWFYWFSIRCGDCHLVLVCITGSFLLVLVHKMGFLRAAARGYNAHPSLYFSMSGRLDLCVAISEQAASSVDAAA